MNARLRPELVTQVRELFAEVDRNIAEGDFTGPTFDTLLDTLQTTILEA